MFQNSIMTERGFEQKLASVSVICTTESRGKNKCTYLQNNIMSLLSVLTTNCLTRNSDSTI